MATPSPRSESTTDPCADSRTPPRRSSVSAGARLISSRRIHRPSRSAGRARPPQTRTRVRPRPVRRRVRRRISRARTRATPRRARPEAARVVVSSRVVSSPPARGPPRVRAPSRPSFSPTAAFTLGADFRLGRRLLRLRRLRRLGALVRLLLRRRRREFRHLFHPSAKRVQQMRPLLFLGVSRDPARELGVGVARKRGVKRRLEPRKKRQAQVPRPRGSKPAQKVRGFALVAEVHHRQRRARDARELLHERRLPRARLADEKRGFRHLHRGGDAFEDAHGVSRLRPSPRPPRHPSPPRRRRIPPRGAPRDPPPPRRCPPAWRVSARDPGVRRRRRLRPNTPPSTRGRASVRVPREHAREDVHRLLVRRDANLGG